jgi:2-polyprenyl-3-methyl-5-hydroxy-6-metoxy-1,4-benzoquinol methylase
MDGGIRRARASASTVQRPSRKRRAWRRSEQRAAVAREHLLLMRRGRSVRSRHPYAIFSNEAPQLWTMAMTYYDHVRSEVRALLPESASSILDIGAGAGATLRWLKEIYPNAKTTGVEINTALHDQLTQNADIAIIGDVDACLPQLQSYDLILCLDVLEHVVDSIGTLRKLSTLLEMGGNVIVSVPNVAHYSVSVPLLLRRQFTYGDAGILDSTHLRFFVEQTAVELLYAAGLVVTKGIVTGIDGPRTNLLDRLSFGVLRHHLAKQYVMRGELGRGKIVQEKIGWKLEA